MLVFFFLHKNPPNALIKTTVIVFNFYHLHQLKFEEYNISSYFSGFILIQLIARKTNC